MLFNREHEPDHAFNNYGREKMGVLSRYEVTLERSLYRALHELQRLQAARDGQTVPSRYAARCRVGGRKTKTAIRVVIAKALHMDC
jgi:hypothetical protein